MKHLGHEVYIKKKSNEQRAEVIKFLKEKKRN